MLELDSRAAALATPIASKVFAYLFMQVTNVKKLYTAASDEVSVGVHDVEDNEGSP